jgi:hypothetical protein
MKQAPATVAETTAPAAKIIRHRPDKTCPPETSRAGVSKIAQRKRPGKADRCKVSELKPRRKLRTVEFFSSVRPAKKTQPMVYPLTF